ncbi:phage tail domain-containing protein [Mammaliicoccus sciuri]|uniref:phage tail domain-containing protein n=1 Tax=Mammaliicoccus sciuri TaxID=1296 RepID=UPI0027EAB16D|nr:phage tail domain-containing protein [Mammaliicoccus sciuri]MDQ7129544.1 phage tail family protein [Mammaliicoccus sciuri]
MTCKNNKWVKLIMENETVNLLENDRFEFLGFDKPEINGKTEITEMNGVDGAKPSVTTFGPFEITLKFRYTGLDSIDLDLFCFELEQKIQRYEPYYLVFSKMPGLKYAVLPTPKVSPAPFAVRFSDIDITYTAYKGHSESILTTDDFSLNNDYWQFGNGLVTDENIKYTHHKRRFQIYNGSSYSVTPINGHHLIITMNIKAPNGFILHNKTTGNKFEYKKALRDNDTVILNGVYPFKNKKRCGIDTNWEYITLAPGYNDFEVLGDGVIVKEIKFTFNYVYR